MTARAAFFDMDKTLVRVNTGPIYVRWRVRQNKLAWSDFIRVTWWSALYSLGVLDVPGATTKALRTFRGIEDASFRAECATWVEREVIPHVTDAARRAVEHHREAGYELALLTTSSSYIAEPVAKLVGIEHVLCTRLEVEDGQLTGRLAAPLCYGRGKVDCAQEWANERGVALTESIFFTDSVTDLPMLEEVGEPRVVNPDLRLERVARQRGWSIESWI